jgi:hypothetical protein
MILQDSCGGSSPKITLNPKNKRSFATIHSASAWLHRSRFSGLVPVRDDPPSIGSEMYLHAYAILAYQMRTRSGGAR